jgi:outer membrane protein assembly factor BamB
MSISNRASVISTRTVIKMNRKLLTIAITSVILAIIIFPASAGSSMMFRMDPGHSGDYSSASGGILPNNQIKWDFDTFSRMYSTPAVADGVVYVGTDDHNIYAINANDGSQKWVFPTGDRVNSSPAVVDDVVYVTSGDKLYALNANDGSQKWVFPTESGIRFTDPTVAAGVVYLGSNAHKVYALNANDGSQKWVFPTGGNKVSYPAVADGIVYVGSDDVYFYALNANDGSQKWVSPKGPVCLSPVVVNGVIYAGCSDQKLYALNAIDGSQKWVSPTPFASAYFAVADGVIYTQYTNGIQAINANNGSQKWVFEEDIPLTSGSPKSSPTVADGVVYFTGHYESNVLGHVYAINANDGSKKWDSLTGPVCSQPMVADGVVYVAECERFVVALGDGKNPTVTWSNPADINVGTPLSGSQLNAVASVPGTFTYIPPAGTILAVGNNQNLHVDFTPADTANFNSIKRDVKINVLKPITTPAGLDPFIVLCGITCAIGLFRVFIRRR